MSRSRAYYRWQRYRTIQKKLGFLKRVGGMENVMAWTGGQPGRLSKGKIHCSCWMCRMKSKVQAPRQDLKSKVSASQQMQEFQLQKLTYCNYNGGLYEKV